jgi:hypothetical protein
MTREAGSHDEFGFQFVVGGLAAGATATAYRIDKTPHLPSSLGHPFPKGEDSNLLVGNSPQRENPRTVATIELAM